MEIEQFEIGDIVRFRTSLQLCIVTNKYSLASAPYREMLVVWYFNGSEFMQGEVPALCFESGE